MTTTQHVWTLNNTINLPTETPKYLSTKAAIKTPTKMPVMHPVETLHTFL